mmetsp:Transcript_9126/g.19933  ORF Transcript_9126/g.19933 Transcript_9126/m.19933 type:complete len:263 (-) Transcript_9126:1239-2027(-)
MATASRPHLARAVPAHCVHRRAPQAVEVTSAAHRRLVFVMRRSRRRSCCCICLNTTCATGDIQSACLRTRRCGRTGPRWEVPNVTESGVGTAPQSDWTANGDLDVGRNTRQGAWVETMDSAAAIPLSGIHKRWEEGLRRARLLASAFARPLQLSTRQMLCFRAARSIRMTISRRASYARLPNGWSRAFSLTKPLAEPCSACSSSRTCSVAAHARAPSLRVCACSCSSARAGARVRREAPCCRRCLQRSRAHGQSPSSSNPTS